MRTLYNILNAHKAACKRFYEIVQLNRLAGVDTEATAVAAQRQTDEEFRVELEKLLDGEPWHS